MDLNLERSLQLKVNISDIPNNKSFDDYPEDTIFVHKENFPRYDPKTFEIIKGPEDPRYETALTIEQINEMIKNKQI